MGTHLKLGMYEWSGRHPETTMKELGITYQRAVPQSLFDCWIFWNCRDIPEKLPKFLSEFKADPMLHIGHGLSKEMAEAIRDWEPPKQPENP